MQSWQIARTPFRTRPALRSAPQTPHVSLGVVNVSMLYLLD
jgi:hypothetical protein